MALPPTFRETVEQVFDGCCETTHEHLVAHKLDGSHYEYHILVALIYIAWKLNELVKK